VRAHWQLLDEMSAPGSGAGAGQGEDVHLAVCGQSGAVVVAAPSGGCGSGAAAAALTVWACSASDASLTRIAVLDHIWHSVGVGARDAHFMALSVSAKLGWRDAFGQHPSSKTRGITGDASRADEGNMSAEFAAAELAAAAEGEGALLIACAASDGRVCVLGTGGTGGERGTVAWRVGGEGAGQMCCTGKCAREPASDDGRAAQPPALETRGGRLFVQYVEHVCRRQQQQQQQRQQCSSTRVLVLHLERVLIGLSGGALDVPPVWQLTLVTDAGICVTTFAGNTHRVESSDISFDERSAASSACVAAAAGQLVLAIATWDGDLQLWALHDAATDGAIASAVDSLLSTGLAVPRLPALPRPLLLSSQRTPSVPALASRHPPRQLAAVWHRSAGAACTVLDLDVALLPGRQSDLLPGVLLPALLRGMSSRGTSSSSSSPPLLLPEAACDGFVPSRAHAVAAEGVAGGVLLLSPAALAPTSTLCAIDAGVPSSSAPLVVPDLLMRFWCVRAALTALPVPDAGAALVDDAKVATAERQRLLRASESLARAIGSDLARAWPPPADAGSIAEADASVEAADWPVQQQRRRAEALRWAAIFFSWAGLPTDELAAEQAALRTALAEARDLVAGGWLDALAVATGNRHPRADVTPARPPLTEASKVLEHARAHFSEAAHWAALLTELDSAGTLCRGTLRAVLDFLVPSYTAADFMAMLPKTGSATFYLPFIERSMLMAGGRYG
jgi:hypothetical protein